MESLTLKEIFEAKRAGIEVYHMKGDNTQIISHTDIAQLAKEADKCNGIILIKTGNRVEDHHIVYVGGESKVLTNLV